MDLDKYAMLIKPAIDIAIKKHEDYNSSVKLEDYFPFGDASYVQMLYVKCLRLVSLVDNPTPNFESTKDTVLDLINYAVFYLDYLKDKRDDKL